MLTIRASVKPSKIEGLGLFADEKIPKGTVVWKYDKRFDIAFDPDEVERFPDIQKNLINRYAYLSIESNKYIYCTDDGRFMNHSSIKYNIEDRPSPNEEEASCVANRDIDVGEEILINYRTFDKADVESADAYLNN